MGSLLSVFGNNVRTRRKQLNLTQAQLSELIDISPSFVGYIEAGKSYPSFKTIELLSIVLKVSPGKLFEDNLEVADSCNTSQYNPVVARMVHDLSLIVDKYAREAGISVKNGKTRK